MLLWRPRYRSFTVAARERIRTGRTAGGNVKRMGLIGRSATHSWRGATFRRLYRPTALPAGGAGRRRGSRFRFNCLSCSASCASARTSPKRFSASPNQYRPSGSKFRRFVYSRRTSRASSLRPRSRKATLRSLAALRSGPVCCRWRLRVSGAPTQPRDLPWLVGLVPTGIARQAPSGRWRSPAQNLPALARNRGAADRSSRADNARRRHGD